MEENKHALSFTGSGAEYFRIWIVNLLLTTVTLGIYSAWAKVRRQQYFDRNTQLAGVCFDYHANPLNILAGRVIAVVLLLAYQFGVGASTESAFLAVSVIIVAGPFLLQRALSFRLRNTSYRGVRFDFTGSVGDAYMAYMPTIFILMLPTLLVKVGAPPRWFILPGLMFLLLPLAHSAIKHFQHSHLMFGDRRAEYDASTVGFYKAYGKALGAGLIGIIVAVLIALLLTYSAKELWYGGLVGGKGRAAVALIATIISCYVIYLITRPYLEVVVGNYVWNCTTLPGITFRSTMQVRPYIKLQTRNTILTLLTLGLYRPFAVVNTYAYRIAHAEVLTTAPFDNVATQFAATRVGASGDGAADMFGFDVSW